MEEEQQEQLTPEAELELLTKKQAELSAKIAQARADNAAKAMNTLSAKAQARIDAEAQEALVLSQIRRNREQRAAEEAAEVEKQQELDRKHTEQRTAQQLLEKRARQQAEELAQHLKDETEKAFRLERELELQLLTLNDNSNVVTEDAQQSAIPGPLARILFPDCSANAQTEAYAGLTSEQNTKLVMKRDAINNTLEFGPNTSTVQTAQPTPEVAPVKTARKSKRNQYVDSTVSKALELLIKTELGIAANPSTLDRLSSEFEEVFLIAAARIVIAQAKVQPMSHDSLMFLIEQLADSSPMVGG